MSLLNRNTDHDQGAGRPNLADTELREASNEYDAAHDRRTGQVPRAVEDRYLKALDEVSENQNLDIERTQRRMDMTGF